MDQALREQWAMVEQDQRISEAIEREQSRLRNFIRRRVADREDDSAREYLHCISKDHLFL